MVTRHGEFRRSLRRRGAACRSLHTTVRELHREDARCRQQRGVRGASLGRDRPSFKSALIEAAATTLPPDRPPVVTVGSQNCDA